MPDMPKVDSSPKIPDISLRKTPVNARPISSVIMHIVIPIFGLLAHLVPVVGGIACFVAPLPIPGVVAVVAIIAGLGGISAFTIVLIRGNRSKEPKPVQTMTAPALPRRHSVFLAPSWARQLANPRYKERITVGDSPAPANSNDDSTSSTPKTPQRTPSRRMLSPSKYRTLPRTPKTPEEVQKREKLLVKLDIYSVLLKSPDTNVVISAAVDASKLLARNPNVALEEEKGHALLESLKAIVSPQQADANEPIETSAPSPPEAPLPPADLTDPAVPAAPAAPEPPSAPGEPPSAPAAPVAPTSLGTPSREAVTDPIEPKRKPSIQGNSQRRGSKGVGKADGDKLPAHLVDALHTRAAALKGTTGKENDESDSDEDTPEPGRRVSTPRNSGSFKLLGTSTQTLTKSVAGKPTGTIIGKPPKAPGNVTVRKTTKANATAGRDALRQPPTKPPQSSPSRRSLGGVLKGVSARLQEVQANLQTVKDHEEARLANQPNDAEWSDTD
jgi:hypothetical protein